jgi:hypothetical protein
LFYQILRIFKKESLLTTFCLRVQFLTGTKLFYQILRIFKKGSLLTTFCLRVQFLTGTKLFYQILRIFKKESLLTTFLSSRTVSYSFKLSHFIRPVVLEGGALREVTLDLFKRHHLAGVVCEQRTPNPLDLAAELEVGQVPPLHLLALQLQTICFALKVKERDVLDTVLDDVRHHGLAVDAEKATPVACIALLEH